MQEKKKRKTKKKLSENYLQLAKKNSELMKLNLYKFNVKTILNIPQFLDLNETAEDKIFDKIIEGVLADNDRYYKSIKREAVFLR